jgi:sterol desaturase/sphingolipid hydroxylase (fatty acid hydroxylase superfamily)
MFEWLQHSFLDLNTRLFEAIVQPLLMQWGLAQYSETAFEGSLFFLLGLTETIVLLIILSAAEKLFPVQKISSVRAVMTDVIYTLIHKLGLFALLLFFILQPVIDQAQTQLVLLGWQSQQVERLWPGVTDLPWVSLLIYVVLFDFVDYWIHRAQHARHWWWQLHAIHHSQRDMTFWSDNRNHVFDDFLRDAIFAFLALLIGVAPSQFMIWIVINRSLQSLQHANVRWHFGAVGERLLVSPSFHRLHHAIGYGHEGAKSGCNFGVLFTIWDQLFRTADFRLGFVQTGIRDQLAGVDYGAGFWRQQWLGFFRMLNPSKRPGARQI